MTATQSQESTVKKSTRPQKPETQSPPQAPPPPAVKPNTEDRRLSTNEIRRYARKTDLGALGRNRLERLVAAAMASKLDTLNYIDRQAAFMEELVDNGDTIPPFPITDVELPNRKPTNLAKCPRNEKHTDARVYAHRARRGGVRRSCVCDSCGHEWNQPED